MGLYLARHWFCFEGIILCLNWSLCKGNVSRHNHIVLMVFVISKKHTTTTTALFSKLLLLQWYDAYVIVTDEPWSRAQSLFLCISHPQTEAGGWVDSSGVTLEADGFALKVIMILGSPRKYISRIILMSLESVWAIIDYIFYSKGHRLLLSF